jgi:two-component system, chemotaxis family, protein-glutamate methylesterase/glutaminase
MRSDARMRGQWIYRVRLPVLSGLLREAGEWAVGPMHEGQPTSGHCCLSPQNCPEKPSVNKHLVFRTPQSAIRIRYKIVVVGASLGGLRALGILLSGLPEDFALPVAIVQHRGSDLDNTLTPILQRHSALPVGEAEDKEVIRAGHVYLSPANYHLLVEKGNFALSTDAAVVYARPSIDVLFESAAETYEEGVIGVLLTGANTDGAQGLAKIKEHGGISVVQEPSTAESSIMPKAAIAKSVIDRVLPLSEIAPFLVNLLNRH